MHKVNYKHRLYDSQKGQWPNKSCAHLEKLPDKTEQRLKPYIDRIKIYVYYQIKGHYPKLVLFDIKYNLWLTRIQVRRRVAAICSSFATQVYFVSDGLILLFKALSIQLFNFR
jgi:hypothetical protein